MKNILLVGNGPNFFSGGVSWTDVVRATARRAQLQNQTEKVINEPLPLVYESIAGRYASKERESRVAFARQMRALAPNDIHRDLMDMGWENLLTTNYDHCLEKSTGRSFVPDNLASETTYSVFRRRSHGTQSVWHIHGDVNGPRTMMLGMHQYGGYLQKLRGYLTNRAQHSPFVFGSDPKLIESGRHSWADLFLRDHVHIVGLGLGYSEIVLWWLLAYKHRLKHQRRLCCGETTYYYMGSGNPSDKSRLDLLVAYGVKIRVLHAASGPPTRNTWSKLVPMLKAL
jgi:SIR2-like domain